MLTEGRQVTPKQRSINDLTSRISKALNFNAFLHQRAQWQLNNTLFLESPFINLMDQIWPCHKIGQVQPRVIIYIIFIE